MQLVVLFNLTAHIQLQLMHSPLSRDLGSLCNILPSFEINVLLYFLFNQNL